MCRFLQNSRRTGGTKVADCSKRLTAAKVSGKFNSTFFAADGNKTGLHPKKPPSDEGGDFVENKIGDRERKS